MEITDLVSQNLLSPMVLFFALGLFAALARSPLSVPEAVAKSIALYLMLAIGFKGGVELAKSGLSVGMISTLVAGVALSFTIPVIGYLALRAWTRLPVADAAAVAAHYGSISIVTFVAASETLRILEVESEGFLVAVAAVMEVPAILSSLLIAKRAGALTSTAGQGHLLHEVGLNPSIVMLVGAFLIGWITGERGMKMIASFIAEPFRGVLCLFLLDMGLLAGRGMREGLRQLSPPVLAFGIAMPLASAVLAALLAMPLNLSVGGAMLFICLAASASYIAVPAAMRLALPQAKPAIYLTLSLGVTFPFNLTVGIPLYLLIASKISG